jgi:hypothetical protein
MAIKFSQFTSGGTISVGSQIVGLDASVSPDNRIFDFPGLGILDTNGSVLLGWSQPLAGTAVNYLEFQNALSGNPVVISSLGGDTNVGLYLTTQGSGTISLVPGAGGLTVIAGTTALGLPVGTTAQRPVPSAGYTRYNSDGGVLEYYDSLTAAWVTLTAGGAAVTSVTGTLNRITSTGGTTPQIDISPSYVGQASINTVGTITTGTWNGNPVAVIYGGTGENTFTAYSVICGGTTSTAPLQSVASVGTIGQVLTSQGVGALPIWTNSGGGGSVTSVSGTVNEIDVANPTTTPVISISATYPGQTSIITTGTVTTGVWNATPVTVSYGGTGNTVLTNYAVLCGGGSAPIQTVPTLGALGQVLTSQGPGALPVWTSTSTGSVTLVTGTVGQIDVPNPSTTPVISIDPGYVGQASITTLGTITTGTWDAGVIAGQYGGTGVANTGKTITLGGNLTTLGGFPSTFMMTGATSVTFPTSGLLSTTVGTVTSVTGTALQIDVATGTTTPVISIDPGYVGQGSITTLGTIVTGTWHGSGLTVPYGGTGDGSFTAYALLCGGTTSTSALQTVSTLGTFGQVLTSAGPGALPTWTSITAGTVTSVSGTALQIDVSNGTTTPVISIDPGYLGQPSITTLGTVTTGIWNASLVNVLYGGTGDSGFTAYSVICGGTTPTGSLQSVASVGTSGQVLTSAGAGSLPTWQTPTVGTVTSVSGTLNRITSTGGATPVIDIAATYVGQNSITTLGTITTGVWDGTPVTIPYGGTGNTTFTAYSLICAGTTSTGTFQNVVGLGASGQVLTSAGAGALPSWQTPTTGTVTSVSGTANRITSTGGATPVIDIAATYVGQTSLTTLGTVTTGTWNGTVLSPTYGGTGVNNSTNTLTLSGNLSTSGAFASTFTMTGATNVTFPTSGTLSTTTGTVTSVTGTALQIDVATGTTTPVISIDVGYVGQASITTLGTVTTGTWHGSDLTVPYGGTGNTTFTPYSVILAGTTATGAFQNVVGVGTSGQVLTSAGAGAIPTWTTPGAGTVTSVSGTANRITSTGGATPVIDIAATYVGQNSITTLGTITTGAWNGTILSPTYGGTGVNNGSNTLTLAGNLTTSGAFASTFTMTAATNVTFPTSGTLLTSAALANYAVLNATNSFAFNEQYQMKLQDYSETVNALGSVSGATTLDLTTANVFTATATANVTISVTNVPASGTAASATILATNFGAYTITWPAGTVWSTGSTPTLLASGVSTVVLYTVNGGATWYGALSGGVLGSVTSVSGTTNRISVATGTTTPVIDIAATYVGQTSITTLGTVGTGTWNGSVVGPTYGGTGVNNGASTLTMAGSHTLSGAFASTFTFTAATNVTFPTSGTLSTTTGTVTSVATGPGLSGGPITSTGTVTVIINDMCTGRLTLSSGVPVTTSDVTAATTIYFTPYKGNYITLYTAGAWQLYTFTQVSIAVPAVATQMYDVFLYDNSGVLTLLLTAWTNDTTRATGLVLQNGVYVQSGATQNRYLGSFRTIASGQTEDSVANRYVWNYYNRVRRYMQFVPTTNWSYGSNSVRQANASTNSQLNMCIGVLEDAVEARVGIEADATGVNANVCVGIGLDSTSTVSPNSTSGLTYYQTALAKGMAHATYTGYVGIGKHSLTWLEICPAAVTINFITSAGSSSYVNAGIQGTVFG